MSFPCMIQYSLIFIISLKFACAISSSPTISSSIEGITNPLPTNETTEKTNTLTTTNLTHLSPFPLTTNPNPLTTPDCYRPSAPYSPTSDPSISECISAANFMSSAPDASVPKTWSAAVPYGSRWNMGYCEIYLDSPFNEPQDVFSLRDVAEEAIRIAMFCARRDDYRRTTGGVMTVGEGGRWEIKVKPRQIPRG